MRYSKTVIGQLNKCYAVSELPYRGQRTLLVAAEKTDPCLLFTDRGELLDTVWEGPGGVMTMVPVPGRDGVFLATNLFYSPNDSKEACLVLAEQKEGAWTVTKLCDFPFLHRFDILTREGRNYLILCALKSGHEHKEDWRFPGEVYACELPETLVPGCLAPKQILTGLTRNHGYTRCRRNGQLSSLVSCESGVYVIMPPALGGDWEIEQLLDTPASDAVLMDLDEDGQPELFVLSPFHGDRITIYHRNGEAYVPVYDHFENTPFLHAICGCSFYGRPSVLCGNREGKRELLCFFYDKAKQEFTYELVDQGAGPANCLVYELDGQPVILAANRETDEIALYRVEPDEVGGEE